MDYKTYQPLAMRTAKFFGDIKLDLQHAALGLTTEFAEFVDATVCGDGKGRLEEVADICWYAALLCHVIGEQLDDVMRWAEKMEGTLDNDAITSLGHVAGYIKRVAIYDKAPTEDMHLNLTHDLSTLMCRVTRDFSKAEIEAALAANIDKLRLRYPDKYSDEAAEARADKNGADCRNS